MREENGWVFKNAVMRRVIWKGLAKFPNWTIKATE